MKILLVEDSEDKRSNILKALSRYDSHFEVVSKESVRGALGTIDSDEKFDLILLDMSLPTFDVSDEIPDGGDAESFGGYEIIQQMSFLDIDTPVIVITHYRTFHGGTKYEDLEFDLSKTFSNIVLGMIYYDHPSDEWENELKVYLSKFKDNK
jgi:CheY-like chemotaxis protein